MRVGIVGAGYVSTYHLRAVQTFADAQVVGIVDSDPERARQMAARFKVAKTCSSLADLAAERPEVIHILTPPESHCALTLEALEMGCHVLVEKPMAATVEECDLMIARAREKGLVLSVNHSMCFDPMTTRALDLVRSGVCGEVLTADYFRSSDYPPWKGGPRPPAYSQGGYPYRDLGVHGLYLVEQFLGPIQQVQASYRGTGRDPNLAFDEWRAIAHCASGPGQVQLSWNTRPMLNELLIQGTRGTLRADYYLQTITTRKVLPGPKIAQLVIGALRSGWGQIWGTLSTVLRFATGRLAPSPSIHYAVIAFHDALRRGQPPPVSAEDGRRLVYWVEQAALQADADLNRQRARNLPRQPARVLVTGAGGFLGGALRRRLEQQGESLRLMVHRPRPEAALPPNVEIIAGDLGDAEFVDRAVEGCELVFHVGAAMRGGAADFERGTVRGTENVLAACRRHQVRRLVYVSSLSVLDHAGRRPNAPVTESSPYEPHPELRGAYTQTKLEAERLVLEAARQGLPAVVLRPGQIFGPGAEQVSPSGAISMAGRWIVLGAGRRLLPLVYVEDVVDAMLLAAQNEAIEGRLFHLVDPEPVTQREYISAARTRLGGRLKAHYAPRWLMYSLAIGVELLGKLLNRGVPLTRYRLRSLRPLWPVQTTAAAEQLGWRPRVGTRKGLELTFGRSLEPRRHG